MGIAAQVPGMEPGRPVRNLLLGAVAALCVLASLPVAALDYLRRRGC